MNELHEQFVAEARELVQQATDDLIALEREGFAPERIDRVFRAFHTLKGSAGMVEMPAMTLALHAAEDLLSAIHHGRLVVTSAVVDQTLACLDQVSRWVDEFESRGNLSPQAGEDARSTAEKLRSFLSADAAIPNVASDASSTPASADGALPEWVRNLIASQRESIARHMQERPSALCAIDYVPHAGCFFNGDDPLQLMRQVPDLLALRIEPRDVWPPLASLDPYACNLRIQGISAGDRSDISSIFRLVPDQIRIVDVPADAVDADDNEASQLVMAVIDAQRAMLRAENRKEEFAGRVGAAARAAANALHHVHRSNLADLLERAGVVARSREDTTPLLAALDQAFELLRHPPSLGGGAVAPVSSGSQMDGAERIAERSLRVNEAKIDTLINLAGELIVAKNSLAHFSRRMEEELREHELVGAIKREHEVIGRLVSEIHSAILELRMVPVGQVLRSFPRLVRDMSHQLGKKVALFTRGESTEADKTIVDRLFEPLVHLLRNAVDHGIESPEQRRTAGKAETASISIQAAKTADRFLVDVIDDGRGIDPAVIRRKAQERGVMSAVELAARSDEQVIDLIFAAGFSTAAEVSDISGRGVGMDVVRTVVEQIGGKVSLTSRVGAGTTVRLDLPMNVAMSRLMVVEAGGQRFGISMDAVSETVRLNPNRIAQIKNNKGFVLRERVVPICSLAELMKLPERPQQETGSILVVVAEMNGMTAALKVDAIHDRLDVVLKPMQGLLAGSRGYAGTTLLGDGQVLLVLDLKEIIP